MPIGQDLQVGNKVAPKNLLKLVNKLTAVGFDVSTRDAALAVTSLMATGTDKIVGSFTDQEWAQIFAAAAHGETSDINLSSPYEQNPNVVDSNLIGLLQSAKASGLPISTLADAVNSLSKSSPGSTQELASLSEQEYQALLKIVNKPRGANSMRRMLVAAEVSDHAAHLINALFNMGFKVWDYTIAQKVLSLLTNNDAAKELLSIQPTTWPALLEESMLSLKQPAQPTPGQVKMTDIVTPPPPATISAPEVPVSRSMSDVVQTQPGAGLPTARMPPDVTVTSKNKKSLVVDMASQYSELAKQAPGAKVAYGEILPGSNGAPIKIKDMNGGKNGPSVRAGMYVYNQDGQQEGMVIGSDGANKLYVVKFPTGMPDSWDVNGDIRAMATVGMGTLNRDGVVDPRLFEAKITAQMSQGQALDSQGNPILPGALIQDPNNQMGQNGGQVLDIKQNGAIIYQNDSGEKVEKMPGSPVEIIKQEDQNGQIQQTPSLPQQTPGVGGPGGAVGLSK